MISVRADGVGESCLGNHANCPGAATCADGTHCTCSDGWVESDGECVVGKLLFEPVICLKSFSSFSEKAVANMCI